MIRRWVESEKGVEGSVGRCAVRLCLAVLCLARGIQVSGEGSLWWSQRVKGFGGQTTVATIGCQRWVAKVRYFRVWEARVFGG